MRLNAAPFLFAPGIALAAHVAGGWSGVAWAMLAWCALLTFATVAHRVAHRYTQRWCASSDMYAGQPLDTIDPRRSGSP